MTIHLGPSDICSFCAVSRMATLDNTGMLFEYSQWQFLEHQFARICN